MRHCWRGSPFGSTSVCFHKGLILMMHYATLKIPPPRHQFIKTCKRERWQKHRECKRSWDGLRQHGHVSLKRKGKNEGKKGLQGRQWVLRGEAAVFLFLMTALLIIVMNQEKLGSRVNKSRWWAEDKVSIENGRSSNVKLSKTKI